MKKRKRIVLWSTILVILVIVAVYKIYYVMNRNDIMLRNGDAHYTHEEVKDYYKQNKQVLQDVVQLVLDKTAFYENGCLKTGIEVHHYNKLFSKNKYIVYENKYKDNDTLHNTMQKFKSKYFTKEEKKLLNRITNKYISFIEVNPPYYRVSNVKKGAVIRFVFQDTTFFQRQEFVYVLDGTDYSKDTGTIEHLDGNWYYHYLIPEN